MGGLCRTDLCCVCIARIHVGVTNQRLCAAQWCLCSVTGVRLWGNATQIEPNLVRGLTLRCVLTVTGADPMLTLRCVLGVTGADPVACWTCRSGRGVETHSPTDRHETLWTVLVLHLLPPEWRNMWVECLGPMSSHARL